MSINYDPLAYEMPWRPNYEGRAVAVWSASALTAMGVNLVSGMPPEPFYWMSGICGTMAMMRVPKAMQLRMLQKHLQGRPLSFISLQELRKSIEKNPDDLWLGYGFNWENRHTQRAFEILKRDRSAIIREKKSFRERLEAVQRKVLKKPKKRKEPPMGQPWIHGLEPEETTISMPLKHAEGHKIYVGTTGSGKTRAFDLDITQAILRGEAVIIIDPKGDKEMRDNAKRVCEALGQPERFLSFHPAFPEESVRLDLLRNFGRPTELASRITALMQSESGDPFTNFSWMALNSVIQGMLIIGLRPTLRTIRRYLEGGIDSLVCEAIEVYGKRVLSKAEERMSPYHRNTDKDTTKRANGMLRFYYAEVQPEHPNSDLEALLTIYSHDRAHFGKMIATLLPVLNMLTSDELGDLLSPDPRDLSDSRLIVDSTKIINNGQVLYLGLDSLSDGIVGSAIGSLALSDATSVSGNRYNYGVDNTPVNIYVDEAAEVLNDPFIQLLNKGRGAGFRLTIATQTFADFAARLGSKEKALQVLGNINNVISLRVTDTETQKFIAEKWAKTRVMYVMRTQGQNTHGDEPILHGGNQGERLMEEEADVFSPPLLGELPNLEYMATISGGRIVKGRLPILTN
ncbi:conjugal transfer protein [Alcaligenes faecalis]|uniref:Conjugal transfer protein n=1 Tax=Alcaligenes faecalis TaxID=511 RepID=A0A1Z3MKS2_ALCFA|nr:conjugative transfer system coupling protein TraD [Alcaligenes faecalis]ASD48412.1 conjugal transfer protein [Alcaligenes faecalis]OSZ33081.1 conjugal transfer protein [Alcaligenes faecalis]OSZ41209.1 conjugal transfer protein [Alcaligenes faecalis]